MGVAKEHVGRGSGLGIPWQPQRTRVSGKSQSRPRRGGGDEGVNRSRGAAFSFGLLKPFCFRGKRMGGSSDLLLTPKSPFPG